MSSIFNNINIGNRNIIKIKNTNKGKGDTVKPKIELPTEEKRLVPKESLALEKTLFISHSSKDKDIVDPFVKMLLDAGFARKMLFYSSAPALGVLPGENINNYLHQKLAKGTFVIFMLSSNWYDSTVCENEMGAAWYGSLRHCNVLLPGFCYRDIKGVVSPSEMSIRYDDDVSMLRDKLGQLKRQLERHFDLEFIDSAWESSREQFLASIQ